MDLEVGDLVRIAGISSEKELNDQLALVLELVENTGRVAVRIQRGNRTLSLRPEKLTKLNFNSKERKYQHCAFWPCLNNTGKPVVFPISSWPKDYKDEIPFLKSVMKWHNPQILGGVTSKGQAKPDFMMYYDAGDTESPLNLFAKRFALLLPDYELFKVEAPEDGYRGTCVLIFSPMTSILTKHNISTVSADESKQWSLEELKEVITFHMSNEAEKMYERHSHPAHRMYGDIPGFEESGIKDIFAGTKNLGSCTYVPGYGVTNISTGAKLF